MRLKQILKEKGITAKEFSAQLGISEASLSLISSGKSDISVSRLMQIAHLLGVTASDIMGDAQSANATCPYCGKPITIYLHKE